MGKKLYVKDGSATIKGSFELSYNGLSGWAISGDSKEEIEREIKQDLKEDAETSLRTLLQHTTLEEVTGVTVTISLDLEEAEEDE